METVMEARSLSKKFNLRHNPSGELKARALGLLHPARRQRVEEFWALRDVSLRIAAGDSIGLLGRNGSGKSTLMKIVAGIHRPTTGQLLVRDGARVGSMIELGIGFHPELTGDENVFMNTAIHGLSRAEALAIYEAVVNYSGLRHFMDVPLKNYSSGMQMRLGFAIAAQLDPDILLLDEIFAVGDEDFQKQCMRTLHSFQERGRTILFVSHSAAAVQAICRRACLLDAGRLLYDGHVDGALTEYRRMSAADPERAVGTRASEAPTIELSELDLSWHRLATGGNWDDHGRWVDEFLRRHGLRPEHYVIEVGCGSLAAAARLLPYMEQNHYWGFEKNMELFNAGVQIELPRMGVAPERGHFIVNDDFDLSSAPHVFHLAIASGLLRRLSLNGTARCMASVVKKLAPGGRFYVTWADNPDPGSFDPLLQSDGTRTFADREPFHYSFRTLAAVAETLGARAERLPDTSHPRGEAVMVLTRE
jgi:ABC-type polysaccharide/polyol phosphate transport system ATPase subunit/SAM-dependent methyltransferase